MFRTTFLIVLFTLVLSGQAFSAELRVPQDYPDLLTALNVSSNGDSIVIDTGVFSGQGFCNLVMNPPKNLLIMSRIGSAHTLIDCQQSEFLTVTDTFSIGGLLSIRGLSITNCITAISIFTYAKAHITACNLAHCYGGLVDWSENSYVRMDSCTIQQCELGLEIHADSRFQLTHSTITNCGTGVFWNFVPAGRMENNTFANNYTALELVLFGADIRNNCLTSNNTGILYGGAFYDSIVARLSFRNNNVYGSFYANYLYVPNQTGTSDNISLDPKYCDETFNNFLVASTSPLLPEHNSSATTIGFIEGVACYCGDVDVSGNVDIGDISAIISYLYLNGPAPTPPAAGEIDGISPIDIADLTRLIDYLYISFLPLPCGI